MLERRTGLSLFRIFLNYIVYIWDLARAIGK